MGRSRGGLTTKIHAATIDENCSVSLYLTAGQAHDGRQFENLYESLEIENVLEHAVLDKGYDADRIRERLRLDGVEAVSHLRDQVAQFEALDQQSWRKSVDLALQSAQRP